MKGPRKGELVLTCGCEDTAHLSELDPPIPTTQGKVYWLAECAEHHQAATRRGNGVRVSADKLADNLYPCPHDIELPDPH